jgi:hypothetical protein
VESQWSSSTSWAGLRRFPPAELKSRLRASRTSPCSGTGLVKRTDETASGQSESARAYLARRGRAGFRILTVSRPVSGNRGLVWG